MAREIFSPPLFISLLTIGLKSREKGADKAPTKRRPKCRPGDEIVDQAPTKGVDKSACMHACVHACVHPCTHPSSTTTKKIKKRRSDGLRNRPSETPTTQINHARHHRPVPSRERERIALSSLVIEGPPSSILVRGLITGKIYFGLAKGGWKDE